MVPNLAFLLSANSPFFFHLHKIIVVTEQVMLLKEFNVSVTEAIGNNWGPWWQLVFYVWIVTTGDMYLEKKYGSFLSLSRQWASDTCSSHLHTVHNFYFSLMESGINHPWSTLLDASTCTLVVNYWCYALPVQQCIQDLKWQMAMMIKGRVLSYPKDLKVN